jgi:hypothetical protein
LWRSAQNEHEAMLKLLLETDKAEVDAKDLNLAQMPLWRTIQSGHKAV